LFPHKIHHGDENSFLEMTGFNRNTFSRLRSVIFGDPEPVERRKRGRPPLLDESDQLGLILLFYRNSTLRVKHLCLLFGVTPSVVRRCICEMMHLIVNILEHDMMKPHESTFQMKLKGRNMLEWSMEEK